MCMKVVVVAEAPFRFNTDIQFGLDWVKVYFMFMFSPRTYNDTLTTARLASGISNKLVNRQNRAC